MISDRVERCRVLASAATVFDADKYYRCANCGFICKIGRDSLGGSSSVSGSYPNDYVVKEDPTAQNADVRNRLPQNSLPASVSFETLNQIGAIFQTIASPDRPFGSGLFGGDGFGGAPDLVTIRHSYAADVTGGCPLCSTLNWRGDN